MELKRRWRVSLAALMHRAHSLGRLSDASYRRGCIQLGQMGYRTAEPLEPTHEAPRTIAEAIRLVASLVSRESLAERVGVGTGVLDQMLATLD